jgi:hypothetical protein
MLGLFEYYLTVLSDEIYRTSKDVKLDSKEQYKTKILRFYDKSMCIFIVLILICVFVMYLAISTLLYIVGGSQTSKFVMQFAVFGYAMLGVVLLNTLYSFYLYRVKHIIIGYTIGISINLCVGFYLSRTFGYEFAIFGFVLGALFLAIFTTITTRKMFGNFAYFYYSAF